MNGACTDAQLRARKCGARSKLSSTMRAPGGYDAAADSSMAGPTNFVAAAMQARYGDEQRVMP
jgi:hypothetical protein